MADFDNGAGSVEEARRQIHLEKEKWYLPLDEGEEMAYCCVQRHRGEKVTAFHLHREDTGAFLRPAAREH